MSAIATVQPGNGQNTPANTKRERISPRIRRAIDALVTGEVKTQKDAAKLVGLSDTHLCRELKKPQIEVFYARRSNEIIRRAQMRATARAVQLIDAASEHVSADMTKFVLATNGIRPPEAGTNINIVNNIAPGYVIDLSGTRLGAADNPLATNAANPLITLDAVRIEDE